MKQEPSREANPLRLLNGGDAGEAINALTRKSAQLSALLVTASGNGFDSFNLYNDNVKGNFIWLCAELAGEVNELAQHIALNGNEVAQ